MEKAFAVALPVALLPYLACGAGCKEIGIGGTIYSDTVLSEDLFSDADCLEIGGDNITLDCAGHTITGAGGGAGIHVFEKENVMIRNCEVSGFDYGVHFSHSSSGLIADNGVRDCRIGLYLSSSVNTTVSDNVMTSNGKGAYAYDLVGSSIEGNDVRENEDHGLEMKSSFNDVIEGNDFTGNRIGIGIYSSGDIEVSGNSVGGCYIGVKTESVRNVNVHGNPGDVISGPIWEGLLRGTREIIGMVGIFLLLVWILYRYRGTRGGDKKLGKEGVERASSWTDWRRKRL